MAKIGELRVETASGTVSIPLHEPSDFSSTPIVKTMTPSGVAGVNLLSPTDADATPIKVYTNSNGIQAFGSVGPTGITTIANYLEDDWGDNALSSRSSTNDGVYAHPDSNLAGDVLIGRYRPVWNTETSGWSAGSGHISASGDAYESVPSKWTTGTVQIDSRQNSHSSTGQEQQFVFISLDVNLDKYQRPKDGYLIRQYATSSATDYDLVKQSGGSFSRVIDASWSRDTNWHTLKSTRDSYGNFELFFDGTSKGTGTDTEHTASKYMGVSRNGGSSTFDFDNLVVN